VAKDPGTETPSGIPQEAPQYVQIMFDMLVLAFQTIRRASPRSSSGMTATTDPSLRSASRKVITTCRITSTMKTKSRSSPISTSGIRSNLRNSAKASRHERRRRPVAPAQLDDLYGSGNADGNRHTHSNLPLILAGGGGGALRPGRYAQHGSKPMTNLLLSMAHTMGAQKLASFGDSTGRLADV